jgi:hypothetical protein
MNAIPGDRVVTDKIHTLIAEECAALKKENARLRSLTEWRTPEGWKLMPREMTEEMFEAVVYAGFRAVWASADEAKELTANRLANEKERRLLRVQYSALLETAPLPPAPSTEG